MNAYKGFKIGDRIKLTTSIKCNGDHYKEGHEGVIHAFPPYTNHNGHFVGLFLDGWGDYIVGCEIEQIAKVKIK